MIITQDQESREAVGPIKISQAGPTPGKGKTDPAKGRLSFDPVDPGAYEIQVNLEGDLEEKYEAPEVSRFSVAGGEEKLVLLNLKRLVFWIEIELVGQDDLPIANEKYRITSADGTVANGHLNSKGWARVEPPGPGECEVTFPNLDQEAWEEIDSLTEAL